MNILLGTDGSRYALAAARAVGRWFSRPGVHVDLLAVTPRTRTSDHRHYGPARSVEKQWRGRARQWLQDAAEPLLGRGLDVERISAVGSPDRVFMDRAERGGYDLVVVGVRGRGEAPYFGGGSVALAALRRLGVNLLLVRDPVAGDQRVEVPTLLHPFRVLVAASGKPESERAARFLRNLLQVEHVTVEVLTVAGEEEKTASRVVRRRTRETAQLLEARGIALEERAVQDEPAAAILREAGVIGADLLVLASRGPEERDEGDSVSLEVARAAPCSVLLIRGS